MKKKLLLMLLVLGTATYAQVGVGTLVPNGSAILDVIANNQGLLIPRVPLKSTTDSTRISNGNVESLLVYITVLNTEVKPGYYYWYKGKWNKIATTDDVITSLGGGTLINMPKVMASRPTNTIESAVNRLTTTVNGVSVKAPTVNTNTSSLLGGNFKFFNSSFRCS